MCNSDIQGILKIIIDVLNFVRFFIPILLIILCTINIFKMVVSKKEDEIKKLRKDTLMKIVYAVIIYLIPYLIPFVLNIVNNFLPMDYDTSWKECWDLAKESE